MLAPGQEQEQQHHPRVIIKLDGALPDGVKAPAMAEPVLRKVYTTRATSEARPDGQVCWLYDFCDWRYRDSALRGMPAEYAASH